MYASAYQTGSYHAEAQAFDPATIHKSQEVQGFPVNPQDIQLGLSNQNPHYESYQQAYHMPDLDFAPPAQEVFEHHSTFHQGNGGNNPPPVGNNNIPNGDPSNPDNMLLSNFTISQQFYLNPYPNMEGPLIHNPRANLLNKNQPVNAPQHPISQSQNQCQSQFVASSVHTKSMNGSLLSQDVASSHASSQHSSQSQSQCQGQFVTSAVHAKSVHGSMNQDAASGYVSYMQPEDTFVNASVSNQPVYQSVQMSKMEIQSFTTGFKKTEYLGKRIENDLIKRTGVIGNLDAGKTEFDDYYESHSGKFFTPELHEVIFYHDNSHIYGIQMIFRDPWGKMEKETYKGELHMSKKISPKNCFRSVFNLDYDEYLTELYTYGRDEITYFKLVSNEGKVFELGQFDQNIQLLNLVIPLTRIIGIGGTFDTCLNGVYFYYN